MKSRNQRGNRPESNFSRRGHDESPNQWTAYGRSDSDRSDRGSYRADQTEWTGSDFDRSENRDSRGGRSFDSNRDYDTSRDSRSRDSSRDYSRDSGYRGSSEYRENQDRFQMNPYPHSHSEYENRQEMDSRRFGAHEGNSFITDRSHEDRSQSHSYSGRGPKGFKRSDERIKEEVCELLTRDHSIDAEDIDVEVKEGEVTLTGSVPDRRMKHLAEDCVERALGVKDVINNIRVKRESSSTTSSDTNKESLTGDRTTTGKKSPSSSTSSTGNPNH